MVEGLELKQLVPSTEPESEIEFEQPSTKIEEETICERWPYVGIILATISSLFFSLCSVIVKWMVHVDPMELAVCRFVGVLLPALPIVIHQSESVFPEGKRLILVLRSFLGTTGLMLSFYAIRNMPLADASVIIFSVPVFVAVFAYIFLKEPCGWFNIITIGLTLTGVILITRPTFIFGSKFSSSIVDDGDYHRAWGALAAFGSTLFGANVYILLRTLKSLHFAVVLTNFGGFALLQTTAVSWYLGVLCWPKCGLERIYMIVLAVFSFLGTFHKLSSKQCAVISLYTMFCSRSDITNIGVAT